MEKDFSSASWQVTKAVGLALGFALVGAFLCSLVSGLFSLSQTVLLVVSSVLKAASILFGAALALREEKGILKGALSGAVFSLLSRLLFCALCSSFGTWWAAILEVVVGGAWGAACGVFVVNFKHR